ncbi:hypothetical protein [Haloechinothrix sp. LS1_15]|uniref:hypothetical protein n=1 Tax=Haloechinothrix sp. LS1_15 TaxID=2652248 RepID=UPI002945CC46|nr:hypothetical protein [Haloechinothrix sp. LS1_15]MDV6014568.1 hypothetical protein [Haloechinothrix sp. LS1_15]
MAASKHADVQQEHRWTEEAREAERVRWEAQAGKAAVTVAGHATDAAECRELLDMLGLELDVVRETAAR